MASQKTVTGMQAVTECKVSGVGGRPFRPAHNRRSNRGTHFQVVSKQQEHEVCYTKGMGMKGVVSKGERQSVK